jgi:hypothetical protein
MKRPPSTSMHTPVIRLASSLHRKQAALPRSSGVEKRPIGMVERNFARISGVSSPMKVFNSGVSPATGFSALTRMPKGASSTALARADAGRAGPVEDGPAQVAGAWDVRRQAGRGLQHGVGVGGAGDVGAHGTRGVACRGGHRLRGVEVQVGDDHARALGDELAHDAGAED